MLAGREKDKPTLAEAGGRSIDMHARLTTLEAPPAHGSE
jgi:hypothetical protein